MSKTHLSKWLNLSAAAMIAFSPVVEADSLIDKHPSLSLFKRAGFSLLITGDQNSGMLDGADSALIDIGGAKAPHKPTLTWHEHKIRSGEHLSKLFKEAGFDRSVMFKFVGGSGEASDLQNIFPGETIRFGKTSAGELHTVEIERSGLESLVVSRSDNGISGSTVIYEPEVRQRYAGGSIESSLFSAGRESGLSTKTIMDLAGIFAWDIDFAKSIRKGDSFHIVYEELYRDGKKVGTGDILSASFVNSGEEYQAVLYTSEDGSSDYYTPDGDSLRKAFLRSPVDFARISSHFNLKRKHPILHTIRAHKGTDYAASRGTPIKASGDGKVVKASKYGGYGNTVIIKHGGNITTLYAHMKSFAQGIYSGKRVKQGDVIGYVGSSGLATGPHLHYEFRINGEPKDPVNVKFANAKPVPKDQLRRFKTQTQPLMLALETRSNGKVSSLASLSEKQPEGE